MVMCAACVGAAEGSASFSLVTLSLRSSGASDGATAGVELSLLLASSAGTQFTCVVAIGLSEPPGACVGAVALLFDVVSVGCCTPAPASFFGFCTGFTEGDAGG